MLKSYYAEESDKVFKPIRSFFDKQGLSASFIAKVGSAADLIADMANTGKFDLLIMGSHGHGSLSKLVLGSVTTKVVAHCQTPVLVVRQWCRKWCGSGQPAGRLSTRPPPGTTHREPGLQLPDFPAHQRPKPMRLACWPTAIWPPAAMRCSSVHSMP